MLPLQPVYVANLHALAPHRDPAALAAMLRDAEQPVRDLAAQIAVHVPMLHGAIPETWLPNAAGAFLMPAWSISLEWQFYLIAPLAFALWRRGPLGIAAWCALAAVAFATRGLWPPFGFDAFLPLRLHLFTIGMASWWLFARVAGRGDAARWAAHAPAAAIAATGAFVAIQCARLGIARGTTPAAWFPLAIWAFAFGVVLAGATGATGPLARGARRLLAARPLERLGVVSYSTYLAHWPVLVACQAAFRALGASEPWTLFGLHLALSLPLVAAASFALHRLVELPGIALGRRLAAGLDAGERAPAGRREPQERRH
jgi:peptidoglycan/LPS O-acetylase OafA/YrhL